jgi:hypothetical protein
MNDILSQYLDGPSRGHVGEQTMTNAVVKETSGDPVVRLVTFHLSEGEWSEVATP